MQAIQKQIIRYVLDFQIDALTTYAGYKGDLILKIVTKNRDDVIKIRKFALDLRVKEVVIKEKLETKQYEVFCVTADKGFYTVR